MPNREESAQPPLPVEAATGAKEVEIELMAVCKKHSIVIDHDRADSNAQVRRRNSREVLFRFNRLSQSVVSEIRSGDDAVTAPPLIQRQTYVMNDRNRSASGAQERLDRAMPHRSHSAVSGLIAPGVVARIVKRGSVSDTYRNIY